MPTLAPNRFTQIKGPNKTQPRENKGNRVPRGDFTSTLGSEKEVKDNTMRLQQIKQASKVVLYTCKTVFPFDFFPDELSIEPTQVNICKKTFFLTNHMLTIPIQNISDVHVQTSPFFSTLKFVDRSFADNTIEIEFLKTDEAEKARKILQGLIIAINQHIDVGKVDPQILVKQVEQIGKMQSLE